MKGEKDAMTPEEKLLEETHAGTDDNSDNELPEWDPRAIAAFLKSHLSEISEEGKRVALEQIEYFESIIQNPEQ